MKKFFIVFVLSFVFFNLGKTSAEIKLTSPMDDGILNGIVDFHWGTDIMNISDITLSVTRSGDITQVFKNYDFNYDLFKISSYGTKIVGIESDNEGNFYIAGYFAGNLFLGDHVVYAKGRTDIFVAKIDKYGGVLWIKTVGGEYQETPYLNSNQDIVSDFIVDGDGNVYIIGDFSSAELSFGSQSIYNTNIENNDIFLAKIDSLGSWEWAISMGGNGREFSKKIDKDSIGNIYILGNFSSTIFTLGDKNLSNQGLVDGFVGKLSSSGEPEWLKLLGGTQGDSAQNLVLDNMNNIYITYTYDYINQGLLKVDSIGVDLWQRSFGHVNDGIIASMMVDDIGYIYIAGYYIGNSTDIFVKKLTNTGNVIRENSISGNHREYVRDISINNTGDIYLLGISSSDYVGFSNTGFVLSGEYGIQKAFLSILNSSGGRVNAHYISGFSDGISFGPNINLGLSVLGLGKDYIFRSFYDNFGYMYSLSLDQGHYDWNVSISGNIQESSPNKSFELNLGCDAIMVMNRSDCESLMKIYQGLDGKNWYNSTNRFTNNLPRRGITVNEDGRVKRMDLYNNLSGVITVDMFSGFEKDFDYLNIINGGNYFSYIEPYVFSGVTFNEEIYIGSYPGRIDIGEGAFMGSKGIKNIVFTSNNIGDIKIGKYAFRGASMDIPNSYSEIRINGNKNIEVGDYAFSNIMYTARGSQPYYIANNEKIKLGDYVFSDIFYSPSISNSLGGHISNNNFTDIGGYTFANLSGNIGSFQLYNNNMVISTGMFKNIKTSSAFSIYIGSDNKLLGIGDYAFAGISKSASINIYNSNDTKIRLGEYLFSGTNMVEWSQIYFNGGSYDKIREKIFFGLNGGSMNQIYFESINRDNDPIDIEKNAFSNLKFGPNGNQIGINNSNVGEIGDYAFSNITNLYQIYINNSNITSFGKMPFKDTVFRTGGQLYIGNNEGVMKMSEGFLEGWNGGSIYIWGNSKITTLPENTFSGARFLRDNAYLTINNNSSLYKIGKGSFNNIEFGTSASISVSSNLNLSNMGGNGADVFSGLLFGGGLSSYFNNNSLFELHDDIFNQFSGALRINIASNCIDVEQNFNLTGVVNTGRRDNDIKNTQYVCSKISYNPEVLTTGNVIGTISFVGGSGTKRQSLIDSNLGNISNIWTENGSHIFDLSSLNNNSFLKSVSILGEVNWIDREPPSVIGVENDGFYTDSVILIDVIDDVGIKKVLLNGQDLSEWRHKEISTIGNNNLLVEDLAGNVISLDFQIVDNQIFTDTEPPIIIGIENGKVYKGGVILIDVIDNVEVSEITLNGNNIVVGEVIDIEGSHTIIAKDISENITEIMFYVISDITAPIGTIAYTPETLTSGNVVATITLSETGTITNNGGNTGYTFTGNGTFTFEFEDLAGNTGEVVAEVTRIDKQSPTIVGVTSGGIYTTIATFSVTDNTQVGNVTLNGNNLTGRAAVTVTEIGTHTIIATDTVGNQTTVSFEIKKKTSSGGGGGSYYVPEETEEVIEDSKEEIEETASELENAYDFAKENKITTTKDLEEFDVEGKLIRMHLAKMISEFAVEVMGKTEQTGENIQGCDAFQDMKNETEEMKSYASMACKLGLMGRESDQKTVAKNFTPDLVVDRAQFGTILSRLLRGDTYATKDSVRFYKNHLQALKENQIMTVIEPEMEELRGRVILMLYRVREFGK